jgi:hypothetical protein
MVASSNERLPPRGQPSPGIPMAAARPAVIREPLGRGEAWWIASSARDSPP